jgi:hypothetical protein
MVISLLTPATGNSTLLLTLRGHRYRTMFIKRLIQGLVFNAYSKIKNPKFGSFLKAPEDLEGLRSQKKFNFSKRTDKSIVY